MSDDATGIVDDEQLEEALGDVPVFPLPQVVLLPGARLPLHIFEPRYRTMLRDCLASHRLLAVAILAPPASAAPNAPHPPIARIAGVGKVVEHEPLPDGRSNILVVGQARVLLDELPFHPPYRRAHATVLVDRPVSVPEHEKAALVSAAAGFASEVKKHDPTFTLRLPRQHDAGALADACAHQLVIDPEVRMRLLEETDPLVRVRVVVAEIARQQGALGREPGGGVLN